MSSVIDDTDTGIFLELDVILNDELACEYSECGSEAMWILFCPANYCFNSPLCGPHKDHILHNIQKLANIFDVGTMCTECQTELPSDPSKYLRKI